MSATLPNARLRAPWGRRFSSARTRRHEAGGRSGLTSGATGAFGAFGAPDGFGTAGALGAPDGFGAFGWPAVPEDGSNVIRSRNSQIDGWPGRHGGWWAALRERGPTPSRARRRLRRRLRRTRPRHYECTSGVRPPRIGLPNRRPTCTYSITRRK